jgi:hypothetical protein
MVNGQEIDLQMIWDEMDAHGKSDAFDFWVHIGLSDISAFPRILCIGVNAVPAPGSGSVITWRNVLMLKISAGSDSVTTRLSRRRS